MNYFSQKLDQLLDRFDLLCVNDKTILEINIMKHIEKIQYKGQIAVWGAGDHTHELFKFVPGLRETIKYIIDNNNKVLGKDFAGIPVISKHQVVQLNIKTIIVSSLSFREEIIQEIKCLEADIEIIDLYKGIEETPVPFYFSPKECIETYYLRKKYETCLRNHEKEEALLELIKRYLSIRDFFHSFQFIDIYIANAYEKSEHLNAFKYYLNELLQELKNTVKNRKQRDIALCIADSLRYKDLLERHAEDETSFFRNLVEESITFTNAFSTSTYTHTSIISMLTGKISTDIKDEYSKYEVNFEESLLLKHLYKNDYEINNYSVLNFFDDERTNHKQIKRNINDKLWKYNPPASKVLWEYLSDLAEGKKNNFSLIHFSEAHTPHICAYHDELLSGNYPTKYYQVIDYDKNSLAKYVKQYKECVKYIENQLQFYFSFLPTDIMFILCSDHGQALGENNALGHIFTWYDEVIHVPLIIYYNNINKEYDQLVSLRNLAPMIMQLIKAEMIEFSELEFVTMYREKLFNPVFISNKSFVDKLGQKFIESFLAIRTKNEKLILYGDGLEEFYILPDEQKNKINDHAFKERIVQLKEYSKDLQ